MPEEIRNKIEAVVMDMWCPNAAIVFDMFHIVAQYNKVIDRVRREETSKAATETDKKVIKGSPMLLNLRSRTSLQVRTALISYNSRICDKPKANTVIEDIFDYIY